MEIENLIRIAVKISIKIEDICSFIRKFKTLKYKKIDNVDINNKALYNQYNEEYIEAKNLYLENRSRILDIKKEMRKESQNYLAFIEKMKDKTLEELIFKDKV